MSDLIQSTSPTTADEPQAISADLPPDPRLQAVAAMQSWAAIPVFYEWDGKHYPAKPPHYGLDCSGAVCSAYDAAEIVPVDYRIPAHALVDECDLIQAECAEPGDLVFYAHGGVGRPVTHVMMVLDAQHVIGAAGGNSATNTIAIAQAKGARVKVCERATYRPSDVVCTGRWKTLVSKTLTS